MLVVSDTSPLTALLKIGRAGLLRQLFSEVLIPPAVESELLRNHPLLPAWLEVRPPKNIPARIGNLVISTASSPIRNSSRRKRTTTASRLRRRGPDRWKTITRRCAGFPEMRPSLVSINN